MKAFVSWSGGKDCMLALHRFLRDTQNEVVGLINMYDSSNGRSRSHGLSSQMIRNQVSAMGLKLIQQKIDGENYEQSFKTAITNLKKEGATAGVFGDIYLEEHRQWIERVCEEAGVEAVFPLWGNDTKLLLDEFISMGFQALTVSIRENVLTASWLGRKIDQTFYNEIGLLDGIDVCAENGEYHSFAYDGPLFVKPVPFTIGETYRANHHIYIEIQP